MSTCTKTSHAILIILLLATASLCIAFGILGAVDERFDVSLDYEQGEGNHTIVYLMLVYGCVSALVTTIGSIAYFSDMKRYMKTVIPIVTFITMLLMMAFVSLPALTKHLHVPVADVLYRAHDNKSICWSGIEVRPLNAIADKHDEKCCIRNERAYCVACRRMYVCDEPTFAKQNYWPLFIFIAVNFILNFSFLHNLINGYRSPASKKMYKQVSADRLTQTTSLSMMHHAAVPNVYSDMPPPPPPFNPTQH
ncbi:arif-1 [Leucania separata nucleopolyhedrovirus]|uniref:Arif-1 n=1 Tax=Leucania separata nucleopolyhedrovirus TaxID=1307956 RepID=Q0IKV7_NPVLS|nr:arif-1 [Leucania separata nucleopolyhedrovirus]AAR28926.1 arif-1 [Leucania separata nucleopolyhedrovirus]